MGCGASSLLSSFDANKCKIQLKMLCIRLDIKIAKERNGAMQDKHKVAELLKGSQEARARILVEHIIRRDFTVESMDLLKLEASILVERFDIVEKEVELTVEVAQMVCSIVYGAYLMGGHIAELKTLGEMLRAKYGRAFVDEVNAHPEKYLPERIMKAIGESGASTINPLIVEAYMVEIAKLKDVEYIPKAVPAHWHTGGAPPPAVPPAHAAVMGLPLQLAPGPDGIACIIPAYFPSHTEGAPILALQNELAVKLGVSPLCPLPMIVGAAATKLGVNTNELGSTYAAQIKAAHTKLCT